MYEYFIHKNSNTIIPRVKLCPVCGSDDDLKTDYSYLDADFRCGVCDFRGSLDGLSPDEWKPSVILEQLGKSRYERNEEYQFKGYDSSELAVRWGLYSEKELEIVDGTVVKESIKQYIFENKNNEVVINDIKEYLNVLIEQSDEIDYNTPIWKALLDISKEDKNAFLQWVVYLLDAMWT